MATASIESPENESGTATHEGGASNFVAINLKPSDITTGGELVEEVVTGQEDDIVKGAKRKRASSPSVRAELDGSSDLTHGASLHDEHEDSGATNEARKGTKAKKGRKKAGAVKNEGKVSVKKATGASKKGKGEWTKNKSGAEGSMGSATLVTTTPVDGDNANHSDTSGDGELTPKGKMAGVKGKMERKVWSSAEDEIIIALHATKTPWKEIAAALNKLPTSSTTLAVDATMATNRWKKKLKHIITWSDEELKTVKTIYDAIVKDPFTALADRMNKELNETKFTKLGCEKKIKEMMKGNQDK
ncbi:hypothetical protein L211DRAFT_851365 [Terfezia boudieri ATCC MYA-4762]|uniref:Myb-like domain-containing protein n=1 Tax=Terfezia boudieri ATCC MYA-4762 TaxID=1051890 RepID=A0A3N4LFI0_9PEZI|nr:hypothetical protein L211DRAFT_851365 [Terfezia boudieri ATCC MYA-4762]